MNEAEARSSINSKVILGALKRRRWWVLITAVAVALLTLAALSILPKRYTSEATLVVVQQQIPERYVTPTSTTDIGEALEATTHEVLSRTQLLDIIREFDLYPQDRGRLSPEELEAKMRKQIVVAPILTRPEDKNIDGFKISFVAESPQKAQAVANRLTSLFIEQNLESREHQANVTTNFLQERLEIAKEKLAQQEARVRDFKLQNLGELPEQQNGNLAVLSGLQSQLQNIQAGTARAQEQRVYLQSLLNDYQGMAARGLPVTNPAGGAQNAIDPIATEQSELTRLKAKKSTLLSIYTPEHPDIIKVNEEIAQAQSLLKSLRTAKSEKQDDDTAVSKPASTDSLSGNSQVDTSLAQVKSQLASNSVELANLARDEKQVKAEIQHYQERLNLTPVREQQLAGLMRDYDLLKQDYTDLLGKETQSRLAASLEKRQAGQQFRLVDRPSLPVVPSWPKRLPIGLGGLAGGLVIGAVLGFLIDIKDGFLYSEEELATHFPVPLVVAIPVLSTSAEKRAQRWKRGLEYLGASTLVLLVFAAEFYELYLRRPS
jgi:protein tyrosine kinase modulator